jgi:DNA-binding CsgD family transcriptional regulator
LGASTSEQRDDLVSRIYEAAADSAGWDRAIAGLMSIVAGEQALFGQFGPDTHSFLASAGPLDPVASAICQQHYNDNAWTAGMAAVPIGQPRNLESVAPRSELVRSGFYDDVLKPSNIEYAMAIKIGDIGDRFFSLSVGRGRRATTFSEQALSDLRSYGVHIERAWRLAQRFEGLAMVHRAQLDAFDGLAAPAMLLDAFGGVIMANAAAVALEASGAIALRERPVRCADAAAADAFAAAVNAALAGLSPRPAPFRDRDGGALVMIAAPIGRRVAGQIALEALARPAAIVTVLGPGASGPSPTLLQEAFGLTPAEARVASELALGDGDAPTARRLGVGTNSLKTHRRRVFEKLGISRQAQLARLLARLPSGH